MFDNFNMNITNETIVGYSWDVSAPEFVVCIVHGIGEHAGRYDRMAMRMQENKIAVLSMDLRGHGLSGGKRGHCAPRETVLSDVDQLIQEAGTRYPGVPVILYGHSMGGNIVLDYRMRGRKKEVPLACVVSAPWILLVRKVNRMLILAMTVMSRLKPDFQIKAGIRNEDLGNVKVISDQAHKELRHDFITARTAMDGNKIGEVLLNSATAGNKRLLLMHGDADRICSVEGSRMFSKVAQNCEYVEWPGYYHEIHNGSGEKDGEAVINFIIEWIKEKA